MASNRIIRSLILGAPGSGKGIIQCFSILFLMLSTGEIVSSAPSEVHKITLISYRNRCFFLGTISSRLVKNFKLTHLASGDILRNQISAKTATGKEAEKYLVKGQLVPDEVVVKLISDELKMIQSSWLLDGLYFICYSL